ncbi:protein nessun dorma isoform X2 [Anabrus simplex]|uniref:protein nessun dorma isoform X2 n=1 Tax=Anabrus simplex TaxID=316456 RepID=UPI0034DCD237
MPATPPDIQNPERLEDYKEILCTHKVLPASDVRKEWAYHADLVLEPSGWQAVWKVSRRKCDDLRIQFPAYLFVMVEGIDTESLTAQVTILEETGGHNISERQEAALINLYPTVTQNYKLMYVHETANFLDKLRFFYDYLWQPWDIEDDDKQDWATAHLEARLLLYHDMQSGRVSLEMVKHIQSLLQEARSLNYNIERLEGEVDDKDDIEAEIFCKLMDMHGRMDAIKKEFEMHEDPQMRNLLIMKKHYNRHSLSRSLESRCNQNVCIIWPGGSVDGYIELLKASKPHITEEAFVRSCCNLQDAVDQAVPGDIILLSTGTHNILGLGEFEKGGSIKGISTPESTRLVPNGAGNVLMNCTGGELILENITIDAQQLQIALAAHHTTVRLNNCYIEGHLDNSSTNEGLLGLSGSKILLQNCNITGFGKGLVIHSQGEASLTSCKISSCNIGIMVFDGGKLDLQKCTVSDCMEYGVKVEISKQNFTANKVGSIGLLNSVGEVAVRESLVLNNCKGDVCVIQTHVDAGYDSDSPTFSFVLSSEGHHTSVMERSSEHQVEEQENFKEPVQNLQESKNSTPVPQYGQKEDASAKQIGGGIDTACDSTFNSLSSIHEEQETFTNSYIN